MSASSRQFEARGLVTLQNNFFTDLSDAHSPHIATSSSTSTPRRRNDASKSGVSLARTRARVMPKTFAIIDCEDDPRWEGLARCVVQLFGRDDEAWHHYRACDGELPDVENLRAYDGFVVSGSSHRAESDRRGAARWARALGDWLRRATAPETGSADDGGPRVLAMTFGSYMCAMAGGGQVGMIPGNAHAVGTTTLTASETFRASSAFQDAVRAYGKPMDASGEKLVVHQNRSQRIVRLPEGATACATSGDDGEEVEIWTSADGRLLAWQHSFSDGVASVLSHKVESGLEVKRSKVSQSKSARDGSNASADELPKNDAGFLIGVARSFLRRGELPPDEDEAYLRERRHKARDTLSWASRRKEEITAARAARSRAGAESHGPAAAKTSAGEQKIDDSVRTRALAARAFTRVSDVVNAEINATTAEVRFLAVANETAADEYDDIGTTAADLNVFVSALKSKTDALRPRLDDALLRIEGEVDRLEQIARAADKRVAALEARAKIFTERSLAALKP